MIGKLIFLVLALMSVLVFGAQPKLKQMCVVKFFNKQRDCEEVKEFIA